ncbi:MAG: A/G-specific adenine glycosylase [Crocinitomicaceae bacterium]|jgi:A/G-specific adenine glycosylase|nr:A/G-specific adenine glycosylase [Crocinitomicaceae bacterium]
MADFPLLIIDWYRRNKRALPWRDTKDPYFIWLSEIILQQTRVDQGMNYYLKFAANYPTVSELANAEEQRVLNDWQGLGYYSRARNLHQAAKSLQNRYNGLFPDKYEQILELKGVGEYTAAAIASFAFGLPHAVLDGNVFRVLSRVFDIDLPIDSTKGKKEFRLLAQSLLPERDSDTYNQAIMEFGALYCVPKNPDCPNCVLNSKCLAFQHKTVEQRPVKTGKIKIRPRYFYYLVISNASEIIISKRVSNDIWKHLYEFPHFEFDTVQEEADIKKLVEEKYGLPMHKMSSAKKHVLSHQHIFPVFIELKAENIKEQLRGENELVIRREELADYPVPRMIERYLLG